MKRKTIVAGLTTLIMLFNGVACQTGGDTQKERNVVVWTAGGTEKYLRDYDYSDEYGNQSLCFSACRNEYEGAQIMLSGDEGATYNVELASLSDSNGNVLPDSAFTVYNQKYIEITQIKNMNSAPAAGYYPDAILPMETAIRYGENKLSGKNQGIWVSLKVPKEQAAGEYNGTFKVTVDGKTTSVPVAVQVYDYTLRDESHVKSSFGLYAEELGYSELDTSTEMFETYYEFMLDHRMNPQHLPGNEISGVNLEGESLDSFLDYAVKYSKDVRCSHYNIPYGITTATIDDGKGGHKTITSVNFDSFGNTLFAMAERSLEENVNIIKKAGTYFLFFDEYDQNGATDTANYNLSKAQETCAAVAEKLSAELPVNGNEAFRNEVIESVRTLKHKVVGTLTEALTAPGVSVPTLDKYDDPVVRQQYIDKDKKDYGDDGELWVYTAGFPYSPIPTYFIDDQYLLSPRLFGWIMHDLNVQGNLYWDVTLSQQMISNQPSRPLQDLYDTPSRFWSANGDGFLMYPGKPYGIYGPVSTLRLEAIRDAYEDYELIYALEEIYSSYGVSENSFDNVMDILNNALFTETSIKLNDQIVNRFAQSRKTLCELIGVAEKHGVVLQDYSNENGRACLTVSAPEDVSVSANGANVTVISTENHIKTYTITQTLDQDWNVMSISSKKGEEMKTIDLHLGGKTIGTNAVALQSKMTASDGKKSVTPELTTETIGETQALKVHCGEIKDRFSLDIDVSDLQIAVLATTMKIDFYLPEDASDMTLVVNGRGEKSKDTFIDAYSGKLQKGWNTLEIPVSKFKGTVYGQLQTLRFILKAADGSDYKGAVDFALGNIIVEG